MDQVGPLLSLECPRSPMASLWQKMYVHVHRAAARALGTAVVHRFRDVPTSLPIAAGRFLLDGRLHGTTAECSVIRSEAFPFMVYSFVRHF